MGEECGRRPEEMRDTIQEESLGYEGGLVNYTRTASQVVPHPAHVDDDNRQANRARRDLPRVWAWSETIAFNGQLVTAWSIHIPGSIQSLPWPLIHG